MSTLKKHRLFELVLAGALILPGFVFAQAGDRLHLRWRGESYVPPFYQGKVLAAPGSIVSVSATAIVGSKISDLSTSRILWYANNEPAGEGIGSDIVRARTPEVPGALFEVRAEVPSLGLVETIEIPVSRPRAVIETRLLDDVFRVPQVLLRAWPYFLTGDPDAFQYNWTVNGKGPDELDDPRLLEIRLQDAVSPRTLSVNLVVRGILNTVGAAGSRSIQYRP